MSLLFYFFSRIAFAMRLFFTSAWMATIAVSKDVFVKNFILPIKPKSSLMGIYSDSFCKSILKFHLWQKQSKNETVDFYTSYCGILACNQSADNTQLLQQHIDSLEQKLANTYKPGFGEFMFSIQNHHSKLWFAGQNHNWKLADFEVHEIMEALDNKKNIAQTVRKQKKLIC